MEGVAVDPHRLGRYAPAVTVGVLVAGGVLTWAGAALLIDVWLERRRHPSLAERLAPFSGHVADEAQLWLNRQR